MNQIYGNSVGKTAQLEIQILKVCSAEIPIEIQKNAFVVKNAQKKANLFYE